MSNTFHWWNTTVFLKAIGDSRVKWSRVGHSTIRTQHGPTSVIMYQYATEIYTTHFKKRFLFWPLSTPTP